MEVERKEINKKNRVKGNRKERNRINGNNKKPNCIFFNEN